LLDAEAVTTLVLAVAAVGGADRKRVAEVGVVASERSTREAPGAINRAEDMWVWVMGDE